MKRLFVSINIPDYLKDNLYASLVIEDEAGIKRVKKDNLHITLLFIGSVSGEMANKLDQHFSKAAADLNSFSLEFDEVIFAPPGKKHPHMAWALFKDSQSFTDLTKAVDEAALGVMPELEISHRDKIFPHATLARFKGRVRLEKIKIIQPSRPAEIQVNSFNLVESELMPAGPAYKIINSYQLQD